MSARLWVAAIALGGVISVAHAETLYVIEQLVVSVNASPDGSGERVAQIHSGDHVELIERQDDLAHVRLASGEEGWVKASYLSSSLPLQDQLNVRSQELERVRQDNTRLEAELASARIAAAVESAKAASAVARPAPTSAPSVTANSSVGSGESPNASSPAADAQPTEPSLFSPDPFMPKRPRWVVALGLSLLALIVGFVLGWRMLDRRIRAKYGGLRIY